MRIRDVTVVGGELDVAAFDRGDEVYVVEATATDERMTVAVQLWREAIFVPVVTKSY